MCSDDTSEAAFAQNGAHPAGSVTGSAKGRPPSPSVAEVSQSQTATARAELTGPTSAKTSRAWSAPAGWLSGERRSGSSPQPYPPSGLPVPVQRGERLPRLAPPAHEFESPPVDQAGVRGHERGRGSQIEVHPSILRRERTLRLEGIGRPVGLTA